MSTQKSISVGAVVRQLRKSKSLTISELADRMGGYDAGNLSRFERGQQEVRKDKLEVIASILDTTVAHIYLFAEYGDHTILDDDTSIKEKLSNILPGPDIVASVPLISWVQAGDWTEIVDNFQPGDAEEWRKTTAKVGSNAFALRVQGDSMVNPSGFPSIPEGTVVIVDPASEVNNGNIVVARLEDTKEATLKKLIIDGPNRYLKPLNPEYKLIQIEKNCTIVGVVKKVEFDL